MWHVCSNHYGDNCPPGETALDLSILKVMLHGTRGLFLESPGNFSGPKSNIQIEM